MSNLILDAFNARSPLPDVCVAGQPSRAQLKDAQARGVKTVVNFCPLAEQNFDEKKEVEALGMAYVHIPVRGAADLTEDNTRRLADVMNDRARYPLFLHCASGNRVGALMALKAFRHDGCNPAQALELGRSAGLKGLEPVVQQLMDTH